MIYQEEATILENKSIAKDFFVITVKSPKIAKAAMPGQFLNYRVTGSNDPLLRRPFGVYGADPKTGILKSLYCVKGKGTEILSRKKTGDKISITGPHGNGFGVLDSEKSLLMVGGGFGTAPLAFLAEKAKNKNITVAIGGRSKELILCEDDFKKLGFRVLVSTDDGTYGRQGLVTDLVQDVLGKEQIDKVITVGPIPMMKAVAKIVEKHNIPCLVTMEERMACGIGVCKGCVAKVAGEYATVCKNGPVFDSKEVEFE